MSINTIIGKQISIYLYAKKCVCAKSLQSCLALCEPMGCSLPGSCVHGILQARILEWAAVPSSRGSSRPRDRTSVSYVCLLHWQAGSLPLAPPGKPIPPSPTFFFSQLCWDVIDIYCYSNISFKHTTWWLGVCIHWEMITTRSSVNIHHFA